MSPTGPAPKMATDSPGEKWLRVRPCQPVGKMSARRAKEDSCAVPGGRGRALKSAKGTRRYCACGESRQGVTYGRIEITG